MFAEMLMNEMKARVIRVTRRGMVAPFNWVEFEDT